jgi:hypothetical protein
MSDNDDLLQHINEIKEEAGDKLTKWEEDFLDSIILQITEKPYKTFSDRQKEVIENIYGKYC